MTGALGRETLEPVLTVLGVQVVALLAIVGVRVFLFVAAKEARNALLNFAEDIHDGKQNKLIRNTESKWGSRVSPGDKNQESKQTQTKSWADTSSSWFIKAVCRWDEACAVGQNTAGPVRSESGVAPRRPHEAFTGAARTKTETKTGGRAGLWLPL